MVTLRTEIQHSHLEKFQVKACKLRLGNVGDLKQITRLHSFVTQSSYKRCVMISVVSRLGARAVQHQGVRVSLVCAIVFLFCLACNVASGRLAMPLLSVPVRRTCRYLDPSSGASLLTAYAHGTAARVVAVSFYARSLSSSSSSV